MTSQERPDMHELTADELDSISGGVTVNGAINEVAQRAVGAALVMWDLCTNWKDPWG